MTAKLRMYGFFFLITVLSATQVMGATSLPDFRKIVREHSSAVVKIIVAQNPSQSGNQRSQQDQIPEELRRFFDFRGAPPSERQRMGMGSGFIISDDGYILTNNHVVDGVDSVLVRMSDLREFDAEVVGTDPRSDLALLRIDAAGLPMLKLALDDDLEVGEWVLAIGSPFGLDYSVTAGIVSAKGRSLPTEKNENYVPFIQTDVAINPGNSGGPLFNLDGEVVGVNSQIFTRSGGSIGLSFAIPSSVANNVVAQLKQSGRVTRGWLGVTIQDVDKKLAESFGLTRAGGALISDISPDGPASKAGLRSGDIIFKFDGKPIPSAADLPHVVGLIAPGSTVKVELMRDREIQTINVEVGGLESDDSYKLSAGDTSDDRGGRLGVEVEALSAESSEHFGISGGVVVRSVEPDSVAADSGIRVRDVITLIDTQPIQSVDEFERAVDALKDGSSVPLRLIRQGSSLFIGLKLPE
ncbi:MAG: DegQ family serine endoprotease [Halioglobus sp.]|nr:DegQ family serine endoprotease [Halioglobus sp.]